LISRNQVRYMALHAALMAAEALTADGLDGRRRMAGLTRAYGLVMAIRGPAEALSFTDFRTLVRGPVSGLLPKETEADGLDAVFAIDPDSGERNVDLEALDGEYGAIARLAGDLPFWPWLRDELAENRAYGLFRRGQSQRSYERRRSFVIRHPAGTQAALRSMPREIEDLYGRVPVDRTYGRWCFPCTICRWPMRVRQSAGAVRVACNDRGHRERGADYRFVPDEERVGPPELVRMGPSPTLPAKLCTEESKETTTSSKYTGHPK